VTIHRKENTMKRLTAVLASAVMALGLMSSTAVPTLALDYTCNPYNDGQARVRLFDKYNKVDAIWTVCVLPNIPGVTGEGLVIPLSADNRANSMVSIGYGNYQGSHGYICLTFYSSHDAADGYLFTEVVVEGIEHSFNFPSGTENRASSVEAYYCYD
jgi:hypothetical protein